MHTIKLDTSLNRLIIILEGYFNKHAGEQCISEIVSAVNQLKPGFDIITDISEFRGSKKECDDFFWSAFTFMKIKSARHIIRVIGSSKQALIKFAAETKLIDNYQVRYVPTLKDAEELLLHLKNRDYR